MQVDRGTLAVQPQAPAVAHPTLTWDDPVYDQFFKTYITQDMFSDAPPENANATSASAVTQSVQAGGTAEKHRIAPEPTDPHELARYPQEQGHVPSGELEKSAEQQEPQSQVPNAYPEEQYDHLHDTVPTDQGSNSFQFAEGAGIAMANTNFQNIPSSYPQSFTSLSQPDALAQVQLPSNTNISTVQQFQAGYGSLPPQTPQYTDAAANTQAGTVANAGVNGAYGLGVQPGGQAVYQSNLQWSQADITNIPTTDPASRSQMHSEYNAVQAPMQTQIPVRPGPHHYPQQQMECKPAAVEYVERSYGIRIRSQDYGIFTQEQNPSTNENEHYMNTGYGPNPFANGGYQPPFVQGSSKNAPPEMNLYKRKHEDADEVIIPPRPPRRRKVSSRESIPKPPGSPVSSQVGDGNSLHANDPVDSFFVSTNYGNTPGLCCQYQFPNNRTICNVLIGGGDRRKRYRHLSTHAQYEENLISSGRLNVADAVVLARLKKLEVKCNIGGCDFRQEVWRTDYVRENHERSCHFDLYMGRVRQREQKKARKSAAEEGNRQYPMSEGNY